MICVGFQEHGRNFEAVSKLIESKTVGQVKSFFFNYKRKYNLLKHVSDYEIRNVCTVCYNNYNVYIIIMYITHV